MIEISISEPMHESEIPAYLESSGFNAACDAYVDQHWKLYTEGLTPKQLDEVREWWGPGAPAFFPREVMGLRPGFYDTLSEPAHNAIMSLIACGLG